MRLQTARRKNKKIADKNPLRLRKLESSPRVCLRTSETTKPYLAPGVHRYAKVCHPKFRARRLQSHYVPCSPPRRNSASIMRFYAAATYRDYVYVRCQISVSLRKALFRLRHSLDRAAFVHRFSEIFYSSHIRICAF